MQIANPAQPSAPTQIRTSAAIRPTEADVVVVGSGVGSLAAAAVLARQGLGVLVLEQNWLPGGCASSYYHKGFVFESGATTLMGIDPGQPLDLLREAVPFTLDYQPLDPAMTVWLDGQPITRWQDRARWLAEAERVFGNGRAQRRFWQHLLAVSDFVWRVSGRNRRFPPANLADVLRLAWVNSPLDFPRLRDLFRSVEQLMRSYGLHSDPRFRRFVDQQLMITAQNTAAQVPALFAAPSLCYTNYTNVYLPGGMIRLPEALVAQIGANGGDVRLRTGVRSLVPVGSRWRVVTQDGQRIDAARIVAGIPVWNMQQLTEGRVQQYFAGQAQRADRYWAAFTLSLGVRDTFPDDLTLHHQIHLPAGESLPITGSHSVFVSLSARGDLSRAPAGYRALAISTHDANPKLWQQLAGTDRRKTPAYLEAKQRVRDAMVAQLKRDLPGFDPTNIVHELSSSPVTWQDWTQRHDGSVGGLPQRLDRPLWRWEGAHTPFAGLFRCGDTVYPGQGVPGVALGGLLAAERVMQGFRA
jgi:C-3',4' desaturase CrtD